MKKNKNDLTPIKAFADCRIIAAAPPEEGQPEKLPRVEIDAYNGGIMDVGYWGPVVIDLVGLTSENETAILIGHENKFMSVFGQSDSTSNSGTALSISGEVMGESEEAKEAVRLGKKGFNIKASVGLSPLKSSYVETGAEVEVNGRTNIGPFTLIEKSILNEVSILPLGADGSTSARIAAKQPGAEASITPGANDMKLDKDGKPIEGDGNENQPDAGQIRAEAVAETSRISKVREVAKDHPEIMATAIEKGHSPDQVELDVLKAELAAEKKRNERPPGPGINGQAENPATPEIIAAAVSMRAGLQNPEKAFGAEVCTRAADLKIHSLTDLVRVACNAAGKSLDYSRHETRDFLQAAFSTRDIADVVAATANKFILEGYGTVEDTWRKVASIRPVVDFKANTGVRLVMTDLLQSLAPSGEIQHGSLSDDTRTVTADTKALMLAVTRKDIINDDLGVLTDLPRRLGYAAARTFNTDFWAAFEAAVAAGFTEARGNYTSGALTSTTMAAAEALYLALGDADGNPIGGELTTLLCGTTAYTPARELFASQLVTDGSTSKKPNTNIYVNRFAPAFSRYLSAAPWLLVGNPLAMPMMQAAFLNGREEPFVETADADFNTLGIQMRCYYDYGAAFGDYRAAVYSTGA